MEEEKKIIEKVKKETETLIEQILEQGIQENNLDVLYKLVDIHKDIANEEYWQKKKEEMKMRYRGYSGESMGAGSYNEGGQMGAYSAGGSYGRRGVKGTGRGRYRGGRGSGRYGEEMMDEMMFHYGNYEESGQYGAEGETMEALENLMESSVEYFKMIKENANSPQEVQMMKYYFKKLSEM